MKRFLVLLAGLATMWALKGLPSPEAVGGLDALTLAAVGFVVLTAFTVGELGAALGLPKVTGYIIAGVALGPQVANILSTTVVQEMRVFNTLALGLIALSAGLELDLQATRRVWKVLTAVVLLKIPLLILCMGGAFYAMETLWPSLGLAPAAVGPLALVVAVLGIGTSPAIALAVVNDTRARGRLTDLLLAIAVVKDLVVVVSLAIALALAKALLDPDAHLDAHVLVHVAEELGSSIMAGAVLGAVLIAYLRFVHQQMLLFVLLMVLVVAEISSTLHLELLLVFIVAGCAVRNLTAYEHDLMQPLERIALPVFVVFFTTAGAGVDLIGTLGLLPLTLALVAARVVAFWVAGRAGGTLAGEGAAVLDNAWLTWLPQAGVTLGLVLLAANALPEQSDALLAVGMALVAIHLLVGPIAMGLGLRRAGEVGRAVPEAQGHDAVHEPLRAPTEEAPLPDTSPMELLSPSRTRAEILEPLGDARVIALLGEAADRLEARIARFLSDVATPRAEAAAQRMVAEISEATPTPASPWLPEVRALYDDLVGVVQGLPVRISLPGLPGEASGPARVLNGIRVGWARRRPELRMIGREAFEARFSEAVREVSASGHRSEAAMAERLGRALLARDDLGAVAVEVEAAASAWVDAVAITLQRAVSEGMESLADELLAYARPDGVPRLPRYSRVEAEVGRALAALDSEDVLWRRAVAAARDHLRLTRWITALRARCEGIRASAITGALDRVASGIKQAARAAVTPLQAMRTDVLSGVQAVDPDAWTARLKEALPLKTRLDLRQAAQAFRQGLQPDRLANALVPALDALPERLVVPATPVSEIVDIRALDLVDMDVARQVRTLLLDSRVPEMVRSAEALVPHVVAAHTDLAEAVGVASYGLGTTPEADPKAAGVSALERAIARVETYLEEVGATIATGRAALDAEMARTVEVLLGVLKPRSGAQRMQSGVAATGRLLKSQADEAGRLLLISGLAGRSWVRARLESPDRVERAIRTGHRRLDGEQMRQLIRAATESDLPPAVARLYADRPVDDRRQFVAHSEALERIRGHLRTPDPVTPLLALVTGARGGGCTSLLNAVQLSARSSHVVRPEWGFHERGAGLLVALGRELGCGQDPASIQEALLRRRTLVLIDSMERFLLPAGAVHGLQEFLCLAATTASERVQWVVTFDASVLGRLDELMLASSLFNQRVRLGCAGMEMLDVLTSRARLGGFKLDLGATGRRLLARESALADALTHASDGALSAALPAWRRALTVQGHRITVGEIRRVSLPFVAQLPDLAQAVLATLYGWGPMSSEHLGETLGASSAGLRPQLQLLAAAELIALARTRQPLWRVPSMLLVPVARELSLGGLHQRGAA